MNIKQQSNKNTVLREAVKNLIISLSGMTEEKSASFSSDLSNLQSVRRFVQEICKKAPGDRERLAIELQLAINEIFCNIVKYGYHARENEEIVIKYQLENDGVYVTLWDRGNSFRPPEIKSPDVIGGQERGFGLYIIHEIADEITYVPKDSESQGEGWNCTRIFKRYFFEED